MCLYQFIASLVEGCSLPQWLEREGFNLDFSGQPKFKYIKLRRENLNVSKNLATEQGK